MVIKNTNLAGTDLIDGVKGEAVDWNDTFDAALLQHIGSDQTEGSIANSTTETEIGEVQVPANRVKSGVLVIATGKFRSQGTGTTVKLYGGPNAAAASNTEFQSITRLASNNDSIGWCIVYFITGLTWSSLNYINITATNGGADAAVETYCESIVCMSK